jgi:glutaconate CoA-transferase subunit B
MNHFTLSELMVVAAAREIGDGEVVFAGMRLPLLAFQLAQKTHAPGAVGIFELGVLRREPAADPILTMGDPANLCGAVWLGDMLGVMSLLQRGDVDLSFIGGAQVDRFGNLNTTHAGGTRLPGSGGACDLASLGRRHIIIMAHEPRRFVERVDYLTSPGYGDGRGWRERVGLPRGGPAAVITTLGVLRFEAETGEMVLASLHPGATLAQARANTGWPLRAAPGLAETPAPSEAELEALRRLDPQGFWTK